MDKVEEFINRRFSGANGNCNFLDENCYYFARILKARFKGEIWYDLVDCHFVFRHDDNFYDYFGRISKYDLSEPGTMNNMVKWSEYKKIDPIHYKRIMRDVIE